MNPDSTHDHASTATYAITGVFPCSDPIETGDSMGGQEGCFELFKLNANGIPGRPVRSRLSRSDLMTTEQSEPTSLHQRAVAVS